LGAGHRRGPPMPLTPEQVAQVRRFAGEEAARTAVHAVDAALGAIERSASPELRAVTDAARAELRRVAGKTLREVFGHTA
jgi:hypothetical protein